ncbi:MAG TPA: tripartite tricarboxylate transporter permease [Dongiaceae bacterium]
MTVADVFSSALSVFTHAALFGAMVIGITMGMVFGAAPGLSAKMGILLLMPLLFSMDPAFGIVLLLSMHAVVHTGGSISSILFGVPGGAAEAATVLDGFPMAKKGEAGQALGASMAASGIGGAIGAVTYFVLLPAFAAIGRLFGAPEYLLLALLGLSAVSMLSHGSPLKGLAMAALGLLAGTVGMESSTGTPRYVFGQLELWDGIDILTVVTGLFAVPELIDLARHQTSRLNAELAAAGCTYRAMFAGMAATWRHRWLTLRTTLIGVVIGMMPGLGAEVASWLAYGHAVQWAKDKSRFGHGAIEGVIAPETANNSKEGGAFLPAVAFGIPSTSVMALLIAAISILGLPVGPPMLRDHPEIASLIGWTILWSNLAAVALFVLVLPVVGRIAYLRIDIMAPIVIAVAITGTVIDQSGWWPIATLLVVSLLGCGLSALDWPRAPFLLGFIMGRLAEVNLVKTASLYGWSALERWPSLVLIAVLAAVLIFALRSRKATRKANLNRRDAILAGILGLAFAAAAVVAWRYPFDARLMPMFASIAGAALCALIVSKVAARKPVPEVDSRQAMPWRMVSLFAVYLGLIPLGGVLVAGAAYAGLHAYVETRANAVRAVLMAAAVAALIWLLFGLWLRLPVFDGLL